MLTETIAFALGVLLAPVIRPLMRPVFVEMVRATLLAVDEVQRVSVTVREDIEDAHAEAKAQRDARAEAAAAAARRAPADAASQPPAASAEPAAPPPVSLT